MNMDLNQIVSELVEECEAFIVFTVPKGTGYEGEIRLAYQGDDRILQALLLGLFEQGEQFLEAARNAIERYESGDSPVEEIPDFLT
jgi:hypothetical protein